MKTLQRILLLSLIGMAFGPARPGFAASTATVTVTDTMHRYPSPSGRYDVVFVPLEKDWTHVQKARPGIVRETTELYAVTLYPAKSNEPVNVMYFADEGAPPSPEAILQSLRWSPNEKYVFMPDKLKAHEGAHAFQVVAPLDRHQAWRLEADHVVWIDDALLVGDLNTKEMPGGVIEFNGAEGKAALLVEPDGEIGYQLQAVSGRTLVIKQFLNTLQSTKTTWDLFVPSCLELNLDTLKKRSTACK